MVTGVRPWIEEDKETAYSSTKQWITTNDRHRGPSALLMLTIPWCTVVQGKARGLRLCANGFGCPIFLVWHGGWVANEDSEQFRAVSEMRLSQDL